MKESRPIPTPEELTEFARVYRATHTTLIATPTDTWWGPNTQTERGQHTAFFDYADKMVVCGLLKAIYPHKAYIGGPAYVQRYDLTRIGKKYLKLAQL